MDISAPILARVPRKPSLQQEDRLPVSTVDEVVHYLVQKRLENTISDETYDELIKLASDIFWLTERDLRAKVVKAARQIGG